MTWNQQQEEADAEEKIDRCVKFSDHVALVVSERKRAFEAWQKAQQLQSEIDALKAAHAWIKTSERIPADNARFLAVVADNKGTEQVEIVEFLSRGPEFLFAGGNETKIVTWWMPLPEPPK